MDRCVYVRTPDDPERQWMDRGFADTATYLVPCLHADSCQRRWALIHPSHQAPQPCPRAGPHQPRRHSRPAVTHTDTAVQTHLEPNALSVQLRLVEKRSVNRVKLRLEHLRTRARASSTVFARHRERARARMRATKTQARGNVLAQTLKPGVPQYCTPSHDKTAPVLMKPDPTMPTSTISTHEPLSAPKRHCGAGAMRVNKVWQGKHQPITCASRTSSP